MKKLFQLILFLNIVAVSCSDEKQEPLPVQPVQPEEQLQPTIKWDETSARFRIYTDETLTLVPVITGTDETTTYTWTLNGEVVSTESYCTFISSEPGEYFIRLVVTNRYGATEDEAKITVQEKENTELPELPEEHRICCFPWTSINIAQGRTINRVLNWLSARYATSRGVRQPRELTRTSCVCRPTISRPVGSLSAPARTG